MRKYKILLGFLGVTFIVTAPAEEIVVAEYQTDEHTLLTSEEALIEQDLNSSFYLAEQNLDRPIDLTTQSFANSLERSWEFGSFAISGVLDWAYKNHTWAGNHYADEQSLTVGSKVSLGQFGETFLYHGYDQDQLSKFYLFDRIGDSEVTRTGLAQILYFADRNVSIRFGYEYEQGDQEFLYQDKVGHRFDIGGLFPIGLGFNAHIQATYGRYSYGGYDGDKGNGGIDIESSRTSLRAAISRSFTSSLSGGFHYSYIDEDFDSELSHSREAWGLNLRYNY